MFSPRIFDSTSDKSWKVPYPSVSFIRGGISCSGSSTGITNVDILTLFGIMFSIFSAINSANSCSMSQSESLTLYLFVLG